MKLLIIPTLNESENITPLFKKIKNLSEKYLNKKRPDYLLVLPWHFKDHIIKKEKKFLDNGGKLIFPLPEIEIV